MHGAAGPIGKGGLLAMLEAIECRVRAFVVWFWVFYGQGVVQEAGW